MTLRAAALLHDGNLDIDARLAALGRDARGLLMRYEAARGECASAMFMISCSSRRSGSCAPISDEASAR